MTQPAEIEPTVIGAPPEAEGVSAESASTGEPTRAKAWSGHPLNIRLSIPLPIGLGRYYMTIVAGRERRSPERLADERRKHPLDTPRNLPAILLTGCVFGLAVYGLMLTLGFWALERFTVVN